jgi:hypothetical protein
MENEGMSNRINQKAPEGRVVRNDEAVGSIPTSSTKLQISRYWVSFESVQELSFRSAGVSREESAVLGAKADSSPINRFGMTMGNSNGFTRMTHYQFGAWL